MCGLRIHLDGEQITRIEGDPDDVLSHGHICPKGVALRDLHTDPDRLRRPVRRVGSSWQELDWEEAYDLAAEGLSAVREEHGAQALAVYLGNPTVHSYQNMLYASFFVRALGTRNRFSATSVDQLPHHFVSHQCLGHQLLIPVPDVDRTELMLMLGANPAASNGGLMSGGDIKARLRALRDRGGRLILVDPRRTETARLASEHLTIRPGTDALFLASLLHVVLASPHAHTAHVPVQGLSALKDAVAPFSPEATAAHTGIDADTTRGIALALATTERAVVYGRMGTSTQRFGGLCQWFILALNTVTGHLDTVGGQMFTSPAVDIVAGVLGISRPGSYDRRRSRVSGRPEVGGELPVSVLREEIETPGDGQVRALVTLAGNPVLSTPQGDALGRALEGLDFMVSLDPVINETTRHADLILPPASPLCRDHYDLAFLTFGVRNVVRWSPPMTARPADARHDWETLAALEARLSPRQGLTDRLSRAVRRAVGPTNLLDLALRTGPRGGLGGLTLHQLRRNPHGIDLGPLEPRLPARLFTKDKTVHLAPEPLLADVPRLRALLDKPPSTELLLIGRRSLRSNNSWMHNAPRLMKGRDRCTLELHPDDAASRQLQSGDPVTVSSRVGAVTVPVEVTDRVPPGVVCLPHGFGHSDPHTRQQVAAAHPGINANILTDSTVLDEATGNAVLNGVPVSVARAAPPAAQGAP